MKFFYIIMFILFLSGCESIESYIRKNKDEKDAIKLRKEEMQKLMEEADLLYDNKDYNEALSIYKRVLVIEPKNEKSIYRIQEINNWLPFVKNKENDLKQTYDSNFKKKEEELKQIEDEKKKLETIIQKEEEEKKQLLIKMSSLKALASAVDALAVNDFQAARNFTKKAMMGYPESSEIQKFWDKINKIEDDFIVLEKIKKEEEKQKKRKEKSEKIKKQIETEIENFKDPLAKDAAIFQSDMEERLKRKSKTELDEIVDKEFAFKGMLDQNKNMKSVELDFLREQSLIVFNKVIHDYEKDEKEGILANFNDTEVKVYKNGIAESYYWVGVFYKNKSIYKKSVDYFKKIKESFSETKFYHPGLYQLGNTYIELKDLESAYQSFEVLIDTPINDTSKQFNYYEEWNDKDLKFNYDLLKKQSFMKMAEIRMMKKEFDFAIQIFENLEDDYVKDSDFYDEVIINKAHALNEKGDFESAYKIYESLIDKGRKCKQYDHAVFFRARTLFLMGKFDEARQKLEEIFLYDPLNTFRNNATYLFGETYFFQSDYSKTVVHIRKAIEEFPNFENRGYYEVMLGKAYLFLALYESAIEVFEKIIEEFIDEPFIPEAHYYLSKTYYEINRYDTAKKILLELGNDFSSHEYAKKGKYLLAEIYFNEKKFERAEKQFRIAYLSDPDSIIAFKSVYFRIKCLREMKLFNLLSKYLKDIVIRNDLWRSKWDNPINKDKQEFEKFYYKILFEYADYLMVMKDYDNAIIMFERVANEYKDGEDKEWAMYLTGKSYELKNDNKNAILKYQNAFSFKPDGFWGQQAQHNMNKILWAEKNLEKAVALSGGASEQRTN